MYTPSADVATNVLLVLMSFFVGQRSLDMSHDDILISVMTALSVDYFKNDLPLTAVPPPSNRTFVLSHLTPFGCVVASNLMV